MTSCRTHHTRGAAIVTALLLVALAVTLVEGLFWQQQVQIRAVENQRLQFQRSWIVRGALDWVRLILLMDSNTSSADHLDEPWAMPLADTHLDAYLDAGSDSVNDQQPRGDIVLSGNINDAEARYNLTNLSVDGVIQPKEVNAFARLLTAVQLNSSFALAAAQWMAASQNKRAPPSENAAKSVNSAATQIVPMQIEDLFALPGFSEASFEKLKNFIVILPKATPVNINTAPAEVLQAKIEGLTFFQAEQLVKAREKAWFRDVSDLVRQLPPALILQGTEELAVNSHYFLVTIKTRLGHAAQNAQALLERQNSQVKTVWVKTF